MCFYLGGDRILSKKLCQVVPCNLSVVQLVRMLGLGPSGPPFESEH